MRRPRLSVPWKSRGSLRAPLTQDLGTPLASLTVLAIAGLPSMCRDSESLCRKLQVWQSPCTSTVAQKQLPNPHWRSGQAHAQKCE
jgi:hypothetical protein